MDLIQKDKQKAAELGVSLRHDEGTSMRLRRGVFGLFLSASASMSIVALYQMGILKRIPEPRIPGLDSNTITRSARAYSLVATPDAVLAIGSYATTMTLAAMGSAERVKEKPVLPLMMAAKVGLDAAMAAKYTWNEWREHRALCFWCLLASLVTFVSVPLVIPEARAALRRLTWRSL